MQQYLKSILWMVFAAVFCGTTVLLLYLGILKLNNPSASQYPVRGVDVASYQGDIDWDTLSRQGISFAFIKATEGSSFTDQYFKSNLKNALKTDLRVGAYHFFSFDSPGRTQAENFIANVPIMKGTLPPAVDFEFYGDKEKNRPEPTAVRAELSILLTALEQHYGTKPIIYATEKAYTAYLAGYYDTYDLWVRNVFTAPKPLTNQTWTFWQYTNREHLNGYHGPEYYIDMNVFNGTCDEFLNYGLPN